MRALDALRCAAKGERPANGALLGTCRLEWRGGEAYGEEAILETFRRSPLDLSVGLVVAGDGNLAWSDGRSALVADLYDERIGRLWRLGPGTGPAPERSVAVPFDTDLRQDRRDILWRTADHPGLEVEQAPAVEALARRIAAPSPDDHRVRAFVLRAFSADESVAILASVFRLSAESTRSASFGFAVAFQGPEGDTLIADEIGRPDWMPRL